MLNHALFSSAPEGLLSTFKNLEFVDYGANFLEADFIDYASRIDKVSGYSCCCNPNQFMAWFHLPSIKHLKLWIQSLQMLLPLQKRLHLDQLQTLLLARSTIDEEEVPQILSLTLNLTTFHLGLEYHWKRSSPLLNGAAILQCLNSISSTIENLSFNFDYYPLSMGEYYFNEEDARS